MKSKIKNKKFLISIKRGFSIGEVLLAAFVLSVAMLAAVNLLIAGFSNSADSRDRIIASMLVQEGIEIARNVRDNNWATGKVTFSNTNFPDVSRAADNTPLGCALDKNSLAIRGTCDSAAVSKVLKINADGYYMKVGATITKFKRKVMIQYFNSSGAPSDRASAATAKLTSVVIWGTDWPKIDLSDCSTATRCVAAVSILTKWGE
ncbi:MAG: Type IV pilus modification protein PilV [Candidatus Moranbacteria bacterium GW2011_GWE2_35_2-]|nr:MAG: Type IV pilus modification protein PilV [Candidatus Moranbacteria bacterium GW2011_GWE2_35_2-]KKQ22525.1 MAG: Type IV pilus modification protein PilV [Candidatus Moranbacteria bacterium GW2011_GWF2_37_11]KKQ29594.1 MAG: Type IV pilus modification protein PilV [Candidatus Moranbacteria bacterium GW2011_GWD1_37_17]KKQ30535.1 MAG: Type IV pilus modification protein PilV [Candidatus Moranbacteria bacterium GW2011_GWE1_37_24]